MASKIKVWVKLEQYEPERVALHADADIDELKEAVLSGTQELKRNFCVLFKQEQLSPATLVPSDTSYDEPILLKRKQLPETTAQTQKHLPESKNVNISLNVSQLASDKMDITSQDGTPRKQSSLVTSKKINLQFQERKSKVFNFEEKEWEKIVLEHQTNACIDLAKFLESRTSIFTNDINFKQLDFDQHQLLTHFLLFSGAHIPDANEPLDVSFNTILDEPLNGQNLVDLINQNKSLTPFIIDSLKRYHALTDVHSVLPKSMDFIDNFNTPELAQSFLELADTITTRTLLIVALESLSMESQRFLGTFIRKNDLPLPLSYYIAGQEECSSAYKINFNCLMEVLCLSSDRLYLQAGSKRCATLGKTSLLPYIFTDKRQESLFTEKTDSALRNSCIDVLFGSVASSPYVIFDVHGNVEKQRNLVLIRAVQLYASLQVLYVTSDDLEEKDSFLELMMSTVSHLPTIVCIFDNKFDNQLSSTQQHQEQLINRFQNHFSQNHWAANIRWITVPLFNTARDLTEFRRKYRAERLIPTFKNLFQELEPSIRRRQPFRSIFAIQSTYLISHADATHPVTIRHTKFNNENELKKRFEHLSDRSKDLRSVTPILHCSSQVNSIQKTSRKMINSTDASNIAEPSEVLSHKTRSQAAMSTTYDSIANIPVKPPTEKLLTQPKQESLASKPVEPTVFEYEMILSCIRSKKYQLADLVQAGELMYITKTLKNILEDIIIQYQQHQSFSQFVNACLIPIMYLLKRQQNLTNFMKTLFKLTKSIKLEKSLSTALSKLSLRMLIHILLGNSDDLVSRTVMSLLSKQNPVPLFNPVSQEIKMIPEVYFLWNSDYPTVLSFGVGPCSGKSSLLNSLFMSSFEQHVKSIYFQNTIDIDFGYHFIAKRPLNIADIHGQPTKEIIEKLQVLFDGFIVQVTNDYLQKNTDQLFKFLSVLPVEKLRMIIVRDVPDDIDLNDNENCPDSLIPFSKFQLSDLRNQDDNQRESLIETLRNNIFRDIRISSHILNSWSQYPIVRRYKKRAQIESLVDGICAEILRNSTTAVSNLKNHLIEAQKQAAKIKNEGFQKSEQDANLQAVIRSYYPVYILFVEYCRLIQQLTKTTFYGEQSDKIFEIQNISFQKNKQLENVKRHECGIIFEDFIQLLKKPNAAMLMNLDILSSELKLQKSILLSENLLAGDLSVENALSIEVLWRNAIVCYKYQPLDVQKYIKESYYRYIEAGFPFEIVDGDNFCLQYEFLLDALLNFQNKNILVISVIGPQNSGKSTLLNYMFGTLFNVRDGRCTRGIYGSLVKSNSTEFEYIMIIDTEGLSSGEKEDLEYDRRIVLFCLAVSHLVIINIKGELDSTMNRMVTLCAHSLQHLGVSRVPEPMVHFVLNQKAFGLDIKNHDTVINKLLQNLEKDGLDKVIEITTNTFHTLPTAYKPERLILNEEESKQIPSVAHTIPDYLEHVQLLCGKLMNSATKCFVKCKAHFSDAPQWLTFSNTVFNVLLKFPDLTYFVDIHEKNQDLVIREHIRQAIEKKLTLRQRQIIVDETRTMTEKKIEEHIDTFFGTILESLRLYLEETLKEHQASQTIRKRGNEFLNTQLTGNKNAWKTTALQANDRVKTEDLWHTGGEEMRELIEKIINSRKKYDEKTAKKIFEDTWNEKIYNIQRKFKEDERSEMAIKYIYPNYHSFETKNLPSSDHIVKFVREIKELNKLNFNELAANMRRIFIHEVSKYASIEEHRVVHSSLPEYSLEKLQGLTYLNEYVLCQLFSGKEYSQIDSPDVYYDAHAIQTTVSDSTHASESAKQPSMFSADNIKRFFNRFGLGISSKQEKYSDMSLIRSQWIAPSANEFRKKVIALLTNEKVQERGQKILPLLKTFDYIYDQIIKVLLENGTRVVSIEINIIQKIVGLINTFLKEINLELNLFYASLSKHVASAFHTVYVILLTKFYFKEQNDHLEQQIHTLQQMKAGLNSYFLRMVVPNIKMDSGFAKNSTNQIFDILHSILKEQADKIITDELQNETDFSREAIQKKCDTAHVGHQGINDIETIKWHIKYIINPNEIIRQGFEQVWKRKEEHIESLLKEERKKFAEVFDKYVSVLKYTLENIKKKTKYKSGVQFIDDLFETSTGEAGQNLINKGKCMALVLYNYLSNKKIEQNYTVGDIKYVLKDIDLFQILIPPDQSIIDLMNREQMRKGYEQCSINDFFEFLEKLIELGSVKKKEFESLPVDLVNMDSNDSKRKLLSKAKGCEILCPCCARPCDVDHTKIKAGFGSEFNKHQCRTGHQYRCMGGTKLEYTNEASIKMCEQIKGDDMIVVSTGRISWKEFKALRQDWDFETQHITAEELEKLRMKYATIWGIIGKTLCKDHYPGMVYVEANVDPTQHFILLLDNSGSMRADNRWSDLLDAVDKFLTIRKSSKTRDTTSIIIFGNEATIACSNEDIKSFDVMSKIKEKEGTVGGGTDFSKPIALIKDTIENANRKKIVTSLIHSVIFLSDGEASYPEAELKTLKANYGSVIENFWSMGLGSSHFIVLEQINTEMNGTFKNITDSKDLVTVYAEIAYGDSSKKAI